MNALKHGAYSKQFAQVGALLAEDPQVRAALLDIAHRRNLHRQRANETAAYLLTQLFQRAKNLAGDRLNLPGDAHDHDSIKQAAHHHEQTTRQHNQKKQQQSTPTKEPGDTTKS
jgi:hypothetical protein